MLRRSPRALGLWGAAAALAVITTAVVAQDLAAIHRHARELGPERDALVATHALELGHALGPSDVSVRRVHRSQLPPGVLAADADAIGRVVAVPVLEGGFIADGNLAPRSRRGLDGALPPGMRAVRVVVRDSLIPPRGAVVDVLASFDATAPSPASGFDATSSAGTAVVGPGVRVISVDRGATSSSGGTGVTLLVTERQARDIAYAATHGTVVLVLAPPEEAASGSS